MPKNRPGSYGRTKKSMSSRKPGRKLKQPAVVTKVTGRKKKK